MGRFNSTTPKGTTKTTNLAGGAAFKTTDKFEVASIVLTSLLKDGFYRTGDETLTRLQELARSVDPLFLAKLAVYARNDAGLRSTTHVLAGELARRASGEDWLRPFLRTVVRRADDILEIYAYIEQTFGKRPIPNALKRATGDALRKFDEYQIAKYRGENRDVKMVDVVNLAHPKGHAVLEKLMNGTLKNVNTWESKLSVAGKAETEEEVAEIKSETWGELLEQRKLGYLALLKNLRNILAQAPESLGLAIMALTNEKFIAGSRVFPFQFLTAMQAVRDATSIDPILRRQAMGGLARALDLSVVNVPRFPGRTLVCLDDSASMGSPDDAQSAFVIGSIFAAALYKANDAALVMFSDDARYMTISPNDSVTAIATELARHRTGNGTNFFSTFVRATVPYDRFIWLSDMQGWMTCSPLGFQRAAHTMPLALEDYRRRTGADPKIFSFDLKGLGTAQLPHRNVYALAGISKETFSIMQKYDEDPRAFIARIEAVTFEPKRPPVVGEPKKQASKSARRAKAEKATRRAKTKTPKKVAKDKAPVKKRAKASVKAVVAKKATKKRGGRRAAA